MNNLSEHEVDRIAKVAVREVLLGMGVNIADPEALKKMQQDFAYLRDWREAAGTIKARSLMAIVGILLSGIAAAVWTALRSH